MYTRPDDLAESAIAAALGDRWGFRAASLEYQAVGFGSHHWLATDITGRRLFATVDDLTAKLGTADDTTDAALDRLTAAFGTALALRTQAGLSFVIAPVPTATGRVAARLCDRYSLAVHPYVAGTRAGEDGEFTSDDDRLAVVHMLTQIHGTRAGHPRADDFVVPHLDALQLMIADTGRQWRSGPYAQPAQELLRAHSSGLRVLFRAYRSLGRQVASRPERMVITHGEPHASNVIVTSGGPVLVGWDTALLAPQALLAGEANIYRENASAPLSYIDGIPVPGPIRISAISAGPIVPSLSPREAAWCSPASPILPLTRSRSAAWCSSSRLALTWAGLTSAWMAGVRGSAVISFPGCIHVQD